MTRALPVLTLVLAIGVSQAEAQVTTLTGLSFGTITSGITTTVAKTSASAARWRITGTFTLGGTFQLTLPGSLTGPGPAIPITFSTTAGQRNTSNNPNGGSSFNPHDTQSIPPMALGTTLYVWLGGSLSPPLNQTPGPYSGTVVLTVTGML